jgi:hypothetical protein
VDTKRKGDIAEQAAILEALKRGWGVLKAIGDRLPYDLVYDVGGALIRVQVKSAWFQPSDNAFVVDNRRTGTNRRVMRRRLYESKDFDFALVYLEELSLFYVFPVSVFIAYGSQIYLIESGKRQRRPRSAEYRDAWDLISNGLHAEKSACDHLSKSGNPHAVETPSQASAKAEEGVET